MRQTSTVIEICLGKEAQRGCVVGIWRDKVPRTNSWLGFRVLEHGHVLYLDFELDVEE
jgi:hypothetical protein